MILKCQSSLPCLRETVEIVLKLSKLLCSLHFHDFNPYHFQDLLNYLCSSKEINPEYSLEGLMLKLKLQYFGHLMRKANLLEKTLMLERLKAGEGHNRGWDDWMASLTQWTWVWANSVRQWRTGKSGMLQFMGWQRVGHDWVTELNWIFSLKM